MHSGVDHRECTTACVSREKGGEHVGDGTGTGTVRRRRRRERVVAGKHIRAVAAGGVLVAAGRQSSHGSVPVVRRRTVEGACHGGELARSSPLSPLPPLASVAP